MNRWSSSKLVTRLLVLALAVGALTVPPTIQTISVPDVVDATVGVGLQPVAVAASEDGVAEGVVHRSEPTAAPIRFSMIGVELPDGVDEITVRTKGPEGEWSGWEVLERLSVEDGPDPDTPEAETDRSAAFTEPLWVGDATSFQVEIAAGDATTADDLRVRATVIDGLGLSGEGEQRTVRVTGSIAEAAGSRPSVVSRAGWGANESWVRKSPSISTSVTRAVVHHTGHAASSVANSYSRAEAPALIRSFQRYHTQTLGWSDIGYNLLIDRFGTVYEGRAGGLDRGVIGAHASGYNANSFGVSVIGNFTSQDASSAAYESLANVIAWKSAIHRMDPLGTSARTYKGNRLRAVHGHRDVGQTSCPGRINDRLWWVRSKAAERMSQYASSPPQRFPDVTSANPHRGAVLSLADSGIINGYSDARFGPRDPLKRGQMSTVIARAFALGSVAPDGRFRDVTHATSHAGHIHAVAKAGYVGGFGDGTFRPDDAISREQMATFLARALRLPPREPSFRDITRGNVHRGNIGALEHAGIVRGTGRGGSFGPTEDLQRDQAASMVAAALERR